MFDIDINKDGLCEKCEAKEKDIIVECKNCKEKMKAFLLTSDGLCAKCDKTIKQKDFLVECKKCGENFKGYLMLSNGLCASCDKELKNKPDSQIVSAEEPKIVVNSPSSKFCSFCGLANLASSNFCKSCGKTLKRTDNRLYVPTPPATNHVHIPTDNKPHHNNTPVIIGLVVLGVAVLVIGGLYMDNQTKIDSLANDQKKEVESTQTELTNLKEQQKKTNQQKANLEKTVSQLTKDINATQNYSQIADAYKKYIPSVAELVCPQADGTYMQGSGVLRIKSGSGLLRVITNAHVVGNADSCAVGITYDVHLTPSVIYLGKVETVNSSADLAELSLTDRYDGTNYNPVTDYDLSGIVSAPNACNKNDVNFGDKVFVLGYPGIGGNTITVTEGIVSGFEPGYIKTSAKIDHGNSGGLALHYSGCTLGIATFASTGEIESLGYLIDLTK